MAQLLFIGILALGMILAITSVMALFRPRTFDAQTGPGKKDDTMPDTVKTMAYVLLIALMFGITSGALGGL